MTISIAGAIAIDHSSRNIFSQSLGDTACMLSIAARVKALRLDRKISQQALAKEAGVSQPTIANIERGRTTEIKGYVLEALAQALNTTPRFILEGAGRDDQGGTEGAAQQAELLGIWRKLPATHQQTLLQTARGLLKASETTPHPDPTKRR